MPTASPTTWLPIVTGRTGTTVFGGQRSEGLYQLVVDADGSIYGVGYTTGHLEGEESTANDGSQCDPLLVKFRADGSLAWVRILSTAFWGEAFALALDGSGGVLVTGNGHPLEGQPPGAVLRPDQRRQLTAARSQGDPPPVGFLMRLDGEGRQLWSRALPAGLDQGRAVASLEAGTFVVGSSGGAVAYDVDGNRLWSPLLQGDTVLAVAPLPQDEGLLLHANAQGEGLTFTRVSAAGQVLSSTPCQPGGRVSGFSGASLVLDATGTTAYAVVGINPTSATNSSAREELQVLRFVPGSLEVQRLHTIRTDGATTRPSVGLSSAGELLVGFSSSDPAYGSRTGGLGLWCWPTGGGEPRLQALGSTSWTSALSFNRRGELLLADELTPVADWNDAARYRGSDIRLQVLTLPGSSSAAPGPVPSLPRVGLDRSSGGWANAEAWVALLADGTVVAQGPQEYGPLPAALTTPGASPVGMISSNTQAFAFLQRDGGLKAWGRATAGGQGPAPAALEGLSVQRVYSSATAFAALTSRGSLVCWGDAKAGGEAASVASLLDGRIPIVAVVSSRHGFAALRLDGSIVSWGAGGSGGLVPRGGGSGGQAPSPVARLFSSDGECAALLSDGSVLVWSPGRPDQVQVQPGLEGWTAASQAERLYANGSTWAASTRDGALLTWPASSSLDNGRPQATTTLPAGSAVQDLVGNGAAWAALLGNGAVRSWGASATGGTMDPATSQALQGAPGLKAVQLVASTSAIAALRQNGSVVSWGYGALGGDSSAVAPSLDGRVPVVELLGVEGGFAARRQDGTVIRWSRSTAPVQGLGGLPVVALLNPGEGHQTFARHRDGSVSPLTAYADTGVIAQLNQPDRPVVQFADPFSGWSQTRGHAPALAGTARLVPQRSEPDGSTIFALDPAALPQFRDPDGDRQQAWLLSDYSADDRQGQWFLGGEQGLWQRIPGLGASDGVVITAATTLRFSPGPAFQGQPPLPRLRALDSSAGAIKERRSREPLAGPAVVELMAAGQASLGNGGVNLLLQGYDANGQRLFGPLSLHPDGLRAINWGGVTTGLVCRLPDGSTTVAWCGYNPTNNLAGDFVDFFLTTVSAQGQIASIARMIDNNYLDYISQKGSLAAVTDIVAAPDGTLLIATMQVGQDRIAGGWRCWSRLQIERRDSFGQAVAPVIAAPRREVVVETSQTSTIPAPFGFSKTPLLPFRDGSVAVIETAPDLTRESKSSSGQITTTTTNTGLITIQRYGQGGDPLGPTITLNAFNNASPANANTYRPDFGACVLEDDRWAVVYPVSRDQARVEIYSLAQPESPVRQDIARSWGAGRDLNLSGLVATADGGLAIPADPCQVLILNAQGQPQGLRTFTPLVTTASSSSDALAITPLASGQLVSAQTLIQGTGDQRSGERLLLSSDGILAPQTLDRQAVVSATAALAPNSQLRGNWNPLFVAAGAVSAPLVALGQESLSAALSNAVELQLQGLKNGPGAPIPGVVPPLAGLRLEGDRSGAAVDDRLEGGDGQDQLRGLLGADTLLAGPGGDWLEGGAGADRLQGGAGDDTLQGGLGDDRLEGEAGNGDRALFLGPRSDYDLQVERSTGIITLRDHSVLRDGTDRVTGVEWFQFADRSIGVRDLVSGYLASQRPSTQSAALDLDGDGRVDLVDQTLLMRASLGTFPDASLLQGLPPRTRETLPAAIHARLAKAMRPDTALPGETPSLDLDGNGRVDPLREGLLLTRYMQGDGIEHVSDGFVTALGGPGPDHIFLSLLALTG